VENYFPVTFEPAADQFGNGAGRQGRRCSGGA
jgi:hypothetical protein